MVLLDATYFKGNLSLPNISYNDREGLGKLLQTVGENNLNYFIEKYEPECLRLMLGSALYESFINGLNEDPIADKWILLRDALFRKEDKYSFSPVANYVYFKVKKDSRTKTTASGEKLEDSSFTKNVSDEYKLVDVWNEMCSQVRDLWKNFLKDNYSDYEEYLKGFEPCGFGYINGFGI